MKRKEKVFGVKFPDGQIMTLLYMVPSRDGYVLTVPYSDSHITLIINDDVVNSHSTDQLTDKHEHLGEYKKSEDYEAMFEKALKPRQLKESEFDRPVVYITRKGWDKLIMDPNLTFVEEETERRVLTYVDLPDTISRRLEVIDELRESPESFFGLCSAGDLLTNREIMLGIDENELGITEFEGSLYEIDISAFLNFQDTENPLCSILKPFGMPKIWQDIQKRLENILNKLSS